MLETIKTLQGAPSVQMNQVPPDMSFLYGGDDDFDPDVRVSQKEKDYMVADPNELYDDEEYK